MKRKRKSGNTKVVNKNNKRDFFLPILVFIFMKSSFNNYQMKIKIRKGNLFHKVVIFQELFVGIIILLGED